jgi:two-component system invasion response regulator UvrY
VDTTAPDHERLECLLQLSRRQLQVARLIALGHTGREAAEALNISYDAIRLYRRRIYSRLGIHSRVELTLWAVENGLVSADAVLEGVLEGGS